ncbi:MAG: AAA family ATPase [Chloroflexi bacterium]|nr:AAA family ATPase [Chloroflexota bacterium]
MNAIMQETSFLSRQPAIGANFVGRQAEVGWIADKLGRDTPQNCNIIGEPRMGKTSLLHHICEAQVGEGTAVPGITVWVRLIELADYRPAAFWQFMLAQTVLGLKKSGTPLPDDELSASLDDARDCFDELDGLIEALIDADESMRLFFFIDDFDVLLAGITSQDLDWLRSLVTRYGDALTFVISSTDSLLSLAEQLDKREASQMVSPFPNLFHNLQLGLLRQDDAKAICVQAAVFETAVPFSDDDLNFLLSEAGRHPDLLKIAVGYLLAARALSEPEDLYEDAGSDLRLDEHVRWLCRRIFERRSVEAQAALFSLVQDGGQIVDPVVLNRLKRHLGLVEKRNGRLTLFSDAFRYWTLRQTPVVYERVGVGETAVSPKFEPQFEYVPEQRMVRLSNGEENRLTPLENRLLVYFLDHANAVCTIDELLENVWGPNKTRAVVEKAVNRLRTKIEDDAKRPRFLLSARGEGYLLRLK